MRILLSAAEASSDAHGAELLRALRGLVPGGGASLDAFGIGGPKLQAQGLRPVYEARELLAMGFTEAVSKLPKLKEALDAVVAAVERDRPDVAVLIDYPEFHFKLAQRLRELGIPAVCFIPPKLWVWRKRRAKKLQELYRKVLCIFPFEPAFFASVGVDARYVGNPLMDELPLRLSRSEARKQLELGDQARVVTLMPGSRPSELRRHIPLMLEGAVRAAARLRSEGRLRADERLVVCVPLPEVAAFETYRASIVEWTQRSNFGILDVRVSRGDAAVALRASDAALVKSGTSTLEAGLLGTPLAVVYRPSFLTARIFQLLIRYRGPVGLVNLAAGWKNGDRLVAREILCEEATPRNLAAALWELLEDEALRTRMGEDFERLRSALQTKESPSRVAAREVGEVAGWQLP